MSIILIIVSNSVEICIKLRTLYGNKIEEIENGLFKNLSKLMYL